MKDILGFGKTRTVTKVLATTPTPWIEFRRGKLWQAFEQDIKREHYSGEHFNFSTYHTETIWQKVGGQT